MMHGLKHGTQALVGILSSKPAASAEEPPQMTPSLSWLMQLAFTMFCSPRITRTAGKATAPAAGWSCCAAHTARRQRWHPSLPQRRFASRTPALPGGTCTPCHRPWPHGAWACLLPASPTQSSGVSQTHADGLQALVCLIAAWIDPHAFISCASWPLTA